MFVSNDNQVKYLEVVETIRIPYCNTCHMMQGHCFLGSVPGRVLQKLCAGTPMSFSHVPSISQALGWWQSCESLDGDFSRPISKVGIQVGNPKPVGWALHFWILLVVKFRIWLVFVGQIPTCNHWSKNGADWGGSSLCWKIWEICMKNMVLRFCIVFLSTSMMSFCWNKRIQKAFFGILVPLLVVKSNGRRYTHPLSSLNQPLRNFEDLSILKNPVMASVGRLALLDENIGLGVSHLGVVWCRCLLPAPIPKWWLQNQVVWRWVVWPKKMGQNWMMSW